MIKDGGPQWRADVLSLEIEDMVDGFVENPTSESRFTQHALERSMLAAAKDAAEQAVQQGGLNAEQLFESVAVAARSAKDRHLANLGIHSRLTYGPLVESVTRQALSRAFD